MQGGFKMLMKKYIYNDFNIVAYKVYGCYWEFQISLLSKSQKYYFTRRLNTTEKTLKKALQELKLYLDDLKDINLMWNSLKSDKDIKRA